MVIYAHKLVEWKLVKQISCRCLKCSKEEFATVDDEDVIGYRKSSFGIEALVGDLEKCQTKYKGLFCEKTSLEEIMLFYVNNTEI